MLSGQPHKDKIPENCSENVRPSVRTTACEFNLEESLFHACVASNVNTHFIIQLTKLPGVTLNPADITLGVGRDKNASFSRQRNCN